ncbi:uncharacterized protein [Thunnus thynnus]|uniref:uncharacterized protein n=1 Tax=Thunnus thynnus TaxID=8237 RepID=UPI0035272D7A
MEEEELTVRQVSYRGRGYRRALTGVLDSFGGGVPHLDYPGLIDASAHDFLLGLMGGADPFEPDTHINIPGHTALPTQLDSTVMNSVTAAPNADQNSGSSLDSPSGAPLQSDISIQSGGKLTSLSSGPDQSPSSFVSHSIIQGASSSSLSSSHRDTHKEQTGNGRQTLLTESHRAVTDQLVSFSDLQTQNVPSDLTGGVESVTGLQIDPTASSLGISHDVTVSGEYSHTDLVTVATDPTGTDAFSDPTGTPLDSNHTAVTDHTQMAGSATEQYNPSGQGPEVAENVELEDTC